MESCERQDQTALGVVKLPPCHHGCVVCDALRKRCEEYFNEITELKKTVEERKVEDRELQMEITNVTDEKITVTDAASREYACEYLKTLKGAQKKVTDFFADSKAKAAATHKAICQQEKTMLDPLKLAETQVKGMIGAYDLAERRRLATETERREQEAAAAMQLAEEAEASGDSEGAAEAVAMAVMESATATCTPKTAGVSTRYEWRVRVVDVSKIPRMFMIVDERALAAYAKATKGKSPVDGVEFYEAAVIGVRG